METRSEYYFRINGLINKSGAKRSINGTIGRLKGIRGIDYTWNLKNEMIEDRPGTIPIGSIRFSDKAAFSG